MLINALNEKVDGLTKQLNTALDRIDVLEKENTILKDRLLIYETPKDSHNSSIPPSKDSLKAQSEKANKLLATRSLREKSNKPTGGQIGHKGHTLDFFAEPDTIERHQADFCTRCGGNLS
jgi:transposase